MADKAEMVREPGGDPSRSKHGMMTSADGVKWSCLDPKCRLVWSGEQS